MTGQSSTPLDVRDKDVHALVGRVFLPYNQARTQQAIANGGRFAYYTTASTALSILSKRRIWLRNAGVMNDFSEISHGLACLDAARKGPAGAIIDNAVDRHFSGLSAEIADTFDALRPLLYLDTYMTCVSEHRASEDARGRLSMWRAYGGRHGVALVFNGAPMFGTSTAIGAFSSPVFYGDPAAFATEFASAAAHIDRSIDQIVHLGRDLVKSAMVQMFRFAALCTKHPGFQEELEWRVIASPSSYNTPRLISAVEVVNGTPQLVIQIELANSLQDGLVGMEPGELIDRVIIGPSQFPWATARAFHQVLAEAGVPDPVERTVVSDIPLRHDA